MVYSVDVLCTNIALFAIILWFKLLTDPHKLFVNLAKQLQPRSQLCLRIICLHCSADNSQVSAFDGDSIGVRHATHVDILKWKHNQINQYNYKLLSNCSKYRANNSTNIQRYCSVICTVENLFAIQVGTCTQNYHTFLLFSDKFIDYSSWIINLLLDVVVCNIALYFYLLFVF